MINLLQNNPKARVFVATPIGIQLCQKAPLIPKSKTPSTLQPTLPLSCCL
jgi:hypothetical protein